MSDPSDKLTPRADGDEAAGRAVDEDLERRIVRRIDGELDRAGRERLSRELLRDPEAHRLMDEYAAADRAAGEALAAALGSEAEGAGAREQWQRLAPHLRETPGGRLRALAAAAAVLLTMASGYVAKLTWPAGGEPSGRLARRTARPRRAAGAIEPGRPLPVEVERLIWQVWDTPAAQAGPRPAPASDRHAGDVWTPLPIIQGPRRSRRAVDRQIFSIFDKDQNAVYLLGVDRTRKTVRAVETDL